MDQIKLRIKNLKTYLQIEFNAILKFFIYILFQHETISDFFLNFFINILTNFQCN